MGNQMNVGVCSEQRFMSKNTSVGLSASPSEPYVVTPLFDPVMEATSELLSSPVKTPPQASELEHTAIYSF